MSKPPKFPAFEKATAALSEIESFRQKLHGLEAEKLTLEVNPKLSPVEAARAFVAEESRIGSELRENRLAVQIAEPGINGLWRDAVIELRAVSDELEGKAGDLVERVEEAASRSLAPLTTFSGAAAGNPVLISAQRLLADIAGACRAAINASPESLIQSARHLRSVIDEAPSRIKQIEDSLQCLRSAAVDVLRWFPTVETEDAMQ